MRFALASLLFALVATTVHAAPPEGTKLSQIIATIEQTEDFAYIDEVEWSSRGYYEIEYRTQAGAEVEVRIDPVSGDMVR